MAHPRKNYTVLIPYPSGGGHWTRKGQALDLLDVEAHALHSAGRIELTSVLEQQAADVVATTSPKAKKVAEQKDAQ